MNTGGAQARLAVVLFQLGGPDSLDAVEPFLYNLFSDPDIIDFPFARLARGPLARLVARNRAGKVGAHYAARPRHWSECWRRRLRRGSLWPCVTGIR